MSCNGNLGIAVKTKQYFLYFHQNLNNNKYNRPAIIGYQIITRSVSISTAGGFQHFNYEFCTKAERAKVISCPILMIKRRQLWFLFNHNLVFNSQFTLF